LAQPNFKKNSSLRLCAFALNSSVFYDCDIRIHALTWIYLSCFFVLFVVNPAFVMAKPRNAAHHEAHEGKA